MIYTVRTILILSLSIICTGQDIFQARSVFKPKILGDNELLKLAGLTNTSHIDYILDNILIPRVVGTPNHEKVFKFITNELRTYGYDVEIDEFEDDTPNFGRLAFRNIIGRHNANADRYLTLACHYDSKYMREDSFVGATDSAVPCAMILNLIHVLTPYLNKKSAVSLKVVFFDGEEAFQEWGPNDSIYGAKHLAKKWNQNHKITEYGETIRFLDTIDVLVLLDLLGTPDPKFYNSFRNTEHLYLLFCEAEERLADIHKLDRYSRNPQQTYFMRRSTGSLVEDDHIPFLRKGIPILHLIPHPFPKVWHTSKDNRDVIDMATVENLNKILRVFIAQYLHLKNL